MSGASRLGLTERIRPVQVDWRSDAPVADAARGPFDAPCWSTRAVHWYRLLVRRPEIRWRRTEADLPRSRPSEESILLAAATQVAHGGVLVYGVCSPEPGGPRSSPRSSRATRAGSRPPSTRRRRARGEDAHYGARACGEGTA
ncbi:MAG: hypothetical protein R3F59_16890 [Myxococcota bacterium]